MILPPPEYLILLVLLLSLAMFLWGRWRHDMVAVAALMASVLMGLVPAAQAFSGFSHPAVITVACVLILSSGLQSSGAVDALARFALPKGAGPLVTSAALTGLAALLSAFMNNVGALALLMPLALQVAARHKMPPGLILMPLAFGSILGGMTTLIGTPPNLVVSGFRATQDGSGFAMFDFLPVGGPVAVAGVAFIVLVAGWLIPRRERAGAEGFETGTYLTEARVIEGSKSAGLTLAEIERLADDTGAMVIGLIRGKETRIPAPRPLRRVQEGDILVIEAEPEELAPALSKLGLKLEEAVAARDMNGGENASKPEQSGLSGIRSDEVELIELVVLPGSPVIGLSATDIRLRDRFAVNLLAVSRQGRRSVTRLRSMAIQGGDVLLMQGGADAVMAFASQYECAPLAGRQLRIPDARKALLAGAIMLGAVAVAGFGLLPAAIAFVAGVLAAMATGVVPARNAYAAVDWPVIVLLGALMPVAGALSSTGAADLIAQVLLAWGTGGNAIIALMLIMVVTMILSDFMNNAATAAAMCPVAIKTAEQLGANPDAFLMAVAIGASCAFLTPIGHQNNTLILGPGGFRFGDYWRLGLPLEAVVLAVGVPMLLIAWPL